MNKQNSLTEDRKVSKPILAFPTKPFPKKFTIKPLLKESKKQIGFFKTVKDIGIGNFSSVKLGINVLSKDKVALKILRKDKLTEKTTLFLKREVVNLKSLDHRCIVKLFQVIESSDKICLVMELVYGLTLQAKILDEGKIHEEESKKVMMNLAQAVLYMHDKEIVHRDIKAENILLPFSNGSNNLLKLCDFGFSTQNDNPLKTYCGSPPYAAPELFKAEFYEGKGVDVWAMGVVLVFMLVGCLPFVGSSVKKIMEEILKCDLKLPESLSKQCRMLIRSVLEADTRKRLKVKDIMEHKWFNTNEEDVSDEWVLSNVVYREGGDETKNDIEKVIDKLGRNSCYSNGDNKLNKSYEKPHFGGEDEDKEICAQNDDSTLSKYDVDVLNELEKYGVSRRMVEEDEDRIEGDYIALYRIIKLRLQIDEERRFKKSVEKNLGDKKSRSKMSSNICVIF